MTDQQLVNYIRQQLSSGYNLNAIRNYLIQYGYSPSLVDEAINVIYHPDYTPPVQPAFQPTPKINSSVKMSTHKLALITALIFMLSSVVMFTYILMGQSSSVPDKLLDVDTEALSQSVKIGDNFEFLIKISSMGTVERYDIKMIYEVLDLTGNLITKKEESIGVETSVSKKAVINIPNDVQPGQYTLKTTAKYSGRKAESSFLFKIKEKVSIMESCSDGLKNQNETNIDCGGICGPCQTCTDELKNQDETETDCGGICEACSSCFDEIKNQGESMIDCGGPCNACIKESIEDLTTAERVARIQEAANTNANEAIALCETMLDQGNKDNCYRIIAETLGSHAYCNYIASVAKRDACYLPFLMRNDFSVCTKITDPNLLQLC